MQVIRKPNGKVQFHAATLGKPMKEWDRLRHVVATASVQSMGGLNFDGILERIPTNNRRTFVTDQTIALRIADAIELYGYVTHCDGFVAGLYSSCAHDLARCARVGFGPTTIGLWAGEQR